MACFDEDATSSVAVEAGRTALRGVDELPGQLLLATSSPQYLGKTNATAALGLQDAAQAVDAGGGYRSGVGTLLIASRIDRPTIEITSDAGGGVRVLRVGRRRRTHRVSRRVLRHHG